MVLKGLNLARLSLTKAFTHGSAQSLVAASQSTYASQNSPFGPLAANAAPWSPKSAASAVCHSQNALYGLLPPGPGQKKLPAQPDNLAALLHTKAKSARLADAEADAVDAADATAPAELSAAAARPNPHPLPVDQDVVGAAAGAAERPRFDTAGLVIEEDALIFDDDLPTPPASVAGCSPFEPAASRSWSVTSGSASTGSFQQLPASSQHDGPRLFIAHPPDGGAAGAGPRTSGAEKELQLLRLSTLGRHADVPAVFDDLISAGHTPSAASYNALLVSAISLTRSKHHVVPNALHVYTDMLQRKVRPDLPILTVILELLSTRALDVVGQKKALDEKRARFGMDIVDSAFLLPADAAEYNILAQDDSLTIALDILDTTDGRSFSEPTYHLLISACARAGRIDDMIRVYSRMESSRLVPQPGTFLAMIDAFSDIGDLQSAVDTYNEYKSLAIRNDNGELAVERNDLDVYVALVRAYYNCGRPDGGDKFIQRITEAAAAAPVTYECIDGRAVIPFLAQAGRLEEAYARAVRYGDHALRSASMALISRAAADKDDEQTALAATQFLRIPADVARASVSLCAMYLRKGSMAALPHHWKLAQPALSTSDSLALTIMYALALIRTGQVDAALGLARSMFGQLRGSAVAASRPSAEVIDEAIETICCFLQQSGPSLSVSASLEVLRMLTDNDGLLPSAANFALSRLDGRSLGALEPDNLDLVAQVQSGLVLTSTKLDEINFLHRPRLVSIVGAYMARLSRPQEGLAGMILQALNKTQDWVMCQQWQSFCFGR